MLASKGGKGFAMRAVFEGNKMSLGGSTTSLSISPKTHVAFYQSYQLSLPTKLIRTRRGDPSRRDSHLVLCNEVAMRNAGITIGTAIELRA